MNFKELLQSVSFTTVMIASPILLSVSFVYEFLQASIYDMLLSLIPISIMVGLLMYPTIVIIVTMVQDKTTKIKFTFEGIKQ